MSSSSRGAFAVGSSLALAGVLLLGCSREPATGEAGAGAVATAGDSALAEAGVLPGGATAPAPASAAAAALSARDREIFDEIMREARAERLESLPVGELIVRLGRRFVGEPYTPGTLDTPGAERLVVNLREFDCVTYVETVLALARIIRAGQTDFAAFQAELERIRYRDGRLDGYASRLHYFSEWIADNQAKGLVLDVTRQLGGIPTDEPIDFMSTHAEAYPKLADPDFVEAIRSIERRLSAEPRYFIPEGRIGGVEASIRDGDIIAATSSVEGLDVAHTGFAIRIDGRLHLMHAPLVGKSLEISELPMGERILRIDGQDGIMVARPL